MLHLGVAADGDKIGKGDEGHHAPSLLIKAGMMLGDVSQVINQHKDSSEFLEEGAHFYEDCATRTEFPESVRTLCYVHFKEINLSSGVPRKVSEVDVGSRVRELAVTLSGN